MALTRQMRRANERQAAKQAKAGYPGGLVQRRAPFEARGRVYRYDPNYGAQEAARRLRKMGA